VTVSGTEGQDGQPRLLVVDTDAVSGAAATEIVRILGEALAGGGTVHWATTGGSSAPGIYRALKTPEHVALLDWQRIHTWWGDDRHVPSDHPLSNVLPFTQVLLADESNEWQGIQIAAANVHPFPVTDAIARGVGPAWTAARYAESLRELVPLDAAGTPVLDLIILGAGPDGHLLSVFPGSAVWDDPGLCAGVPAPTHVEPHVERVTMHPRLLAAARAVLLITTGASKADRLADGWAGGDAREVPLRAARLPQATWIVDEAAAAGIRRD
jgi:6-phosphogluconolactonase